MCTQDETAVTTKNIEAVSPSYLRLNAIGNSDTTSHSQSSTYRAVSKLIIKNSKIESKRELHILITLNNILPYTPKYLPKLAIAKKENKGKTNTNNKRFCI